MEKFIWGKGYKMNQVVLGEIFSLTKIDMRGNLKEIKETARVLIIGRMGERKLDNGRMERVTEKQSLLI
jgi:hypothetical protein